LWTADNRNRLTSTELSPYSPHIFAALVLLAAVPALADDSVDLPDPVLTPGAIAETSTDVICAPGYSRAHRVWHNKAGTLAKYSIPLDQAALYEDDDLVPVCLGGANGSPLNHWPQVWDAARSKDQLEVRICARVCADRDDAELARYQTEFMHDWTMLERTEVARNNTTTR
jgi:hypothetical protein